MNTRLECPKCGCNNIKLDITHALPIYICEDCGKKFAPGDEISE